MASATEEALTIILLEIDWRMMSSLDNLCACTSISSSIFSNFWVGRLTETSTTCESMPCSACDRRSAATNAGLHVWSAITLRTSYSSRSTFRKWHLRGLQKAQRACQLTPAHLYRFAPSFSQLSPTGYQDQKSCPLSGLSPSHRLMRRRLGRRQQ